MVEVLSVKRGRFSTKDVRSGRKRCPNCGSLSLLRRTRKYFEEKTKYHCQVCKFNFDVPVLNFNKPASFSRGSGTK